MLVCADGAWVHCTTILDPTEGTRKPCCIWEILVGEHHISFKYTNGEHMNCTFCVRVNMRSPFDLYIWFNHKNKNHHQNAIFIPSVRSIVFQSQPSIGENSHLQSIYFRSLLVSASRRVQNPKLEDTIKDMNRALERHFPVPMDTSIHRSKGALVYHLTSRQVLILVNKFFPGFP